MGIGIVTVCGSEVTFGLVELMGWDLKKERKIV